MSYAKGYLPIILADHIFEIGNRNRNDSGYPVYSVTNRDGFVPSEGYFKKQVFSEDTTNYKIVPQGAFAYNPTRVNVGSIDYLRREEPVLVSPLYIVFRTSDKLHAPYLKRFLLSRPGLAQIDYETQGAVRDSLKFSSLKRIKIPLPPLDEQKRIAAVLDKADALRRQRQESLLLTGKLLQSVFLDMFGDPVSNPKRWPDPKLGKLLTFQQYGPRFYNETYSSDGIRIVRITDLDENGELEYSSMPRFKVSNTDREKYQLRAGDLIFARTGATAGKVALIKPDSPPCIAGAYFITMRFAPELDPDYARAVLTSPSIRAIIAKNSLQAAQPNFSGPALRQLPMPLPPLSLQQEFVRRIRVMESLRATQLEAIFKQATLFSSTEQRAYRGELDLTRVVLEPSADTPAGNEPAKRVAKRNRPKATTLFLQAPAGLEPLLKRLDRHVSRGVPIPWSADYFKYRILAIRLAPISLADLMQKSESIFEEPPLYDTIREMIFDLLGQDGKPALLRQRFQHKKVTTKDAMGNKIVSVERRIILEHAK